MAMFSIRNIGGAALFLFGTTFLWLTPEFASKNVSTAGLLWSITRVGSWATVVAFTAATWGLFTRAGWWESVAIGASLLGLLVLVPFWIAAHRAGEVTPWFTVLVHVVGIAGVCTLLLLPQFEPWVDRHVMAR
jgi:uncharacterized membrane protein YuzA (DUF378 family)